mmetsp:Transcript_22700/g.56399  ORF Transcript_22700/g.56399 Transcript_22700/m.56399 type:complete len:87 (+) Transcript_22700:1321-1581(+)
MLILASNQPDQFDFAANDRIDDIIEFNLPGKEERLAMLRQYFEKYIKSPEDSTARKIDFSGVVTKSWQQSVRSMAPSDFFLCVAVG